MWPVFGAGRLVTLIRGPASLEYNRRKRIAGDASRVLNRGGIARMEACGGDKMSVYVAKKSVDY